MLRRTAILGTVLVSVALALGVGAGAAGAWTLPADAGAAPGSSVASYCAAFPADPSTAAATLLAYGAVAAPPNADVSLGALPSETLEVGVAPAGPNYGNVSWQVQSQGGSGAWDIVAAGGTLSGGQISTLYTQSVTVPAGPARLVVGSSTSEGVDYWVSAGPDANLALEQSAVVQCLNGAAGANQAHSDSAALLAELETLDADVRSGNASSAPAQAVELSPADRQLLVDAANGAHDDLWLLGGAVLGVFVCWSLARALWWS